MFSSKYEEHKRFMKRSCIQYEKTEISCYNCDIIREICFQRWKNQRCRIGDIKIQNAGDFLNLYTPIKAKEQS